MSTPRDPQEPTRATSRRAKAKRVGPYRIDGELGRGGMGVVYRAFDERLHRDVALKALPVDLARDPEQRAQLEREARAIALVSHANVAAIHGLEESDGTLYLVLELVEGETLRERLDRGTLALDEALATCGQVAAGLAAVHRKGLVHRDLKPSNIMVTSDGVAKLLDFGLARRVRDESRSGRAGRDEIVGTSGFMSPEQLRGETVDARSDAFAWGCLLYECLAGAPAFPGTTWEERDAATLSREPDWARVPSSLPPGVVDLLRSSLSKDRVGRLASLDEARRVLDEARMTSSARKHAAALPKHFLPAERDAFVGREQELAELAQLLDDGARLVSVLGIGGTGKTRLVLHVARRVLPGFSGGGWFCDLSEARSVEGIASAVASALDVPLAKDDPVAQLGHAIAGRGRCLVILDNFEQVARHAGDTLGKWLDRAGEATFVVTTREVLGLAGERSLALAPLVPKDATELFVERARAARLAFTPDEAERAEIGRLVKLLDYLPLAIELAAARVRVMPPRVLLERMSERFKLLSSSGARHTRQATLRATFDWSWELLSDDERSALAQLSVFEGGFTLEAAEVVLALQELWPADAVQALVNKSWVRPSSEGRFDVLVSVQEYAAEKLDAQGDRAEAEQRHGACFAAMGAEEALDALGRHEGVPKQRALALELDNLIAACRRAVSRGDGESAVATLAAAWSVLELRGPSAMGVLLGESVLGIAALPPALVARALRTLAEACRLTGQWEETRKHQERALAICRGLGDRRSEGNVLANVGTLHHDQGQLDEAREHHERALAIHCEVGNRRNEGRVLGNLGIEHLEQGRMAEAREHHERALAIHREVGDRRCEGSVLGNLGILHAHQGRVDEAREHFEHALAIHREVGNRHQEGFVLGNLGILHLGQGRMGEAREHIERALAIHREVGSRRLEGMVLGNLGYLHLEQGRMDEAHDGLVRALAIHRELGNRRSEGIVLGNLGYLHLEQGRMDEARDQLVRALAIHREVGNRHNEAFLLGTLGRLHDQQGRKGDAREDYERALAIHRELGNRSGEGAALGSVGTLHLDEGRMDDARACLDAGERVLRDVRDRVELAKLLCLRVRLEARVGQDAAARDALAEAEVLAGGVGLGAESELGRALARARIALDGGAS